MIPEEPSRIRRLTSSRHTQLPSLTPNALVSSTSETGGGLSPDGQRWIACRPGFFLPVRVLSRLFRRRFLEALENAHRTGKLQFFSEHLALADADAFADWLAPLRKEEWVVYAKRPFAGPQAVLAYLSRTGVSSPYSFEVRCAGWNIQLCQTQLRRPNSRGFLSTIDLQ
jgi:hypothetical protein